MEKVNKSVKYNLRKAEYVLINDLAFFVTHNNNILNAFRSEYDLVVSVSETNNSIQFIFFPFLFSICIAFAFLFLCS